jgi:hypothetical protein
LRILSACAIAQLSWDKLKAAKLLRIARNGGIRKLKTLTSDL